MSEKPANDAAAGIDRLLAEAGLRDAADLRGELLELRALAEVRPEPSAQLQALMVPGAVLRHAEDPATDSTAAAPVDELSARRSRRRLAVTAVAVAASLAAGATAAAASDGGIPAALSHLGEAVGTVVAKVLPAPAAPPAAPAAPSFSPHPTEAAHAPGAAPAPSTTATPPAGNPAPVTPHHSGSSVEPRKDIPVIPSEGPVKVPVPAPTAPVPVPSPSLPEVPAKP